MILLAVEWARLCRDWFIVSLVAPGSRSRRGLWGLLFALSTVGVTLFAQPVWAAVQLNYFNAVAYPNLVNLVWSTASELNVAGFDMQYKLAGEPDTSYQVIALVPAKGGPGTGALYELPVFNIQPGSAYCFRLEEKTTDGSKGEILDRCGYGPGITPTPGPTTMGSVPTFVPGQLSPLAATPFPGAINPTSPLAAPQGLVYDPNTGQYIDPATGQPVQPTPAPVYDPNTGQYIDPATGLPVQPTPAPVYDPNTGQYIDPVTGQPVQPTATPVAPVYDPNTGQYIDPTTGLPVQPTPTAAPVFDPSSGQYIDPLTGQPVPPTPTAAPVFDPSSGQYIDPLTGQPVPPTPTATPAAPVYDPNTGQYIDPLTGQPVPPTVDPFATPAADVSSAMAPPSPLAEPNAVAFATQLPVQYIVVTATPTQAPVALAPVLTPLATVTPAPSTFQVAGLLEPSAQNVMVMLLCLTFVGATSIGVIGLVTSVLFMRARSSQRDFYDRYHARRRMY